MCSRFIQIILPCLFTILAAGCAPDPTPPPRNFATGDLVIPLDAMPHGWYVSIDVEPSRESFGQAEGSLIQFNAPANYGGVAFHEVYRYARKSDAARKFDDALAERYQPPPHVIDGWQVPEQLSYKSPIADRFYVACADVEVSIPSGRETNCYATAQYEEYLSIFKTHLVENYMSYEDLTRILESIDQEMAARLKKSTPPPMTP